MAQGIIEERFNGNLGKNQDMLESWINHGFTDKNRMAIEIIFQIAAGGDTSSGAIRATMLYIASNYRVLQKLRTEIDAAVRDGSVSSPITNAESVKLPYLQAVIKEGLRIHPPSSGLLMKQVPGGGDVIDGQFIPAGTRVGHSLWAMQRDTDIYGPDVDVFRPERWIEASPDRLLQMERHLDQIFGYGRYICMGKPVAYMQLNKVFVEV